MGEECKDDACCAPVVVTPPPTLAGEARRFKIHGMDCAEEVATLKGALRGLVPEEQLGFDVLNGRMSVPVSVAAERVVAAVAATGMRAEPWVEAREPEAGHAWSTRDALVVASGVGTAAGFGVHVALAPVEAVAPKRGEVRHMFAPVGPYGTFGIAAGAGQPALE